MRLTAAYPGSAPTTMPPQKEVIQHGLETGA